MKVRNNERKIRYPLVSVIVPFYNRPIFLRATIESVIAQTLRPIELILVDDGSNAETTQTVTEIVRSIDHAGVAIRIVRQPNGGAPSARNRGLTEAEGSYIQFLDSDDVLYPEKLEKQMAIFALFPRVEIVYSKADRVTKDLTLTGRYFGEPLTGDSRDLVYLRWQTMCSLTKSSVFDRIGNWNVSLKKGQEAELNLRAILAGVTIKYLPHSLAAHRSHDNGHLGEGRGLLAIQRDYLLTYRICLQEIQQHGRLDDLAKHGWFWNVISLIWPFQACGMQQELKEARALITDFELATKPLNRILAFYLPQWASPMTWRLFRRYKWLVGVRQTLRMKRERVAV